MIINLVWPRTPDAAWYDNYLVVVSLIVVVIVGAIIYAVQKARGVDLSATIHEIDESPTMTTTAIVPMVYAGWFGSNAYAFASAGRAPSSWRSSPAACAARR
jgi:hypothetical protein